MRTVAALILVALTTVLPARAGANESPLVLSAVAVPRTTTIGTPFRYTLRIESPPQVELLVPLLAERIGEFLITDFGEVANPSAASEDRLVIERWYTLVSYETGDLLIPGVALQYRGSDGELETDYFPDAPVTMSSLLDSQASPGETAVLRSIKGPLSVPANRLWFWIAICGCAALLLAATALWWWSSHRRGQNETSTKPAHSIALAQLSELRRLRLLENNRIEEYYVRLSAVLREYIEARFSLHAPEMTSDEFLFVAQRDSRLSAADRVSLQSFLGEADLVKFARHLPKQSDGENAWKTAKDFIDHTANKAEQTAPEVSHAVA